MESGVLCPATAHVPAGEKPVLWFSAHPYYEPTARKAVTEMGVLRVLDIPEMHKRAKGLVRFGYPRRLLLRGSNLRQTANIHPDMWRGLTIAARRQGANPDDWWGCLEPVLVYDCVVDVMAENLRWERVAQPSDDEPGTDKD